MKNEGEYPLGDRGCGLPAIQATGRILVSNFNNGRDALPTSEFGTAVILKGEEGTASVSGERAARDREIPYRSTPGRQLCSIVP